MLAARLIAFATAAIIGVVLFRSRRERPQWWRLVLGLVAIAALVRATLARRHVFPQGDVSGAMQLSPYLVEQRTKTEAPKGELGFYLISDGGPNPYRYRIRPPSLINLTILEDMCLGSDVADVVLIFGSVDIVLGEVDR